MRKKSDEINFQNLFIMTFFKSIIFPIIYSKTIANDIGFVEC